MMPSSVHVCTLLLTFLLLVCEVVVSRLCSSLITLVDGFHTLFILMHMTLPPAPTIDSLRGTSRRLPVRLTPTPTCLPLNSPAPAPPSPPLTSTPTQTPSKCPHHLQFSVSESTNDSLNQATISFTQPPNIFSVTQHHHARLRPSSPITPHGFSPETPVSSHQPPTHSSSPSFKTVPPLPVSFIPVPPPIPRPPPSLRASPPFPPSAPCGLSYSQFRVRPVGALMSALFLAALCISVCLEILSHTLKPHPIQRPLLAVVVGVLSLLHNLLVLGLGSSSRGWGWGWGSDQLLGPKTGAVWEEDDSSLHLGLNGQVKASEQTNDKSVQGCIDDDICKPPTDPDGSFPERTMVLCNPATSSVLDPDNDSRCHRGHRPPSPLGFPFHSPVAQGHPSEACYRAHTLTVDSSDHRDFKQPNAHVKDPFTEASRPSACLRHSEHQTVPNTSASLQPVRPPDSPKPRGQRPACLPSILIFTQTLLCSILAVLNGLILLLADPESLHDPGACGLLIYLDPAFSTVAVIVLMATALPQLYKYGLLVLQTSPPRLCVPDLGRRIASVPGVQAVHDLHVWQLTETCTVASVHVHCHAGFQLHGCGDLLSAVTKVLQSEGVSCCTVQPEFLLSAPTANCSLNNNSSISPHMIHREVPPLPPVMACSLACGKACAGKMCCTLLVEETCGPLAPSGDEMEEEPQMLIIENTFL